MKLPSLENLYTLVIATILRFPLAIIAACVGTFCSMYSVQIEDNEYQKLLGKIILTSSLALPLLFAAHIFTEQFKTLLQRIIIITTAFSLLLIFYVTTPLNIDLQARFLYRYFLWSTAFHLLVAFSAFSNYTYINGFWQFNKHLFLRFLTAALYSGVLYLGLAGAILAVAELFNINISWKRYMQLWVFIAGIFNTIFFLGGMPSTINDFIEKNEYPKGLKIFTQFVLIPLVTIYLFILYAYIFKIVLQIELPKGWVANLIIAFSISGIFSLLLVFPIKDNEENKWINLFSKFYYISLIPMVVLLFIAIGRRINDYGITIERYMVASLGVWLAFITLYFIFSKKKNIILIPVSLAVLFFLTSIGPWGAFKVSERNQINRLEKLLLKNNMLKDGKIIKLNGEQVNSISAKDKSQIGSLISYLIDNHGIEGIKRYFNLEDTCAKQAFVDTLNNYERKQKLEDCMGMKLNEYYSEAIVETSISISYYCNVMNNKNGLNISGYSKILNFHSYHNYTNNTNRDSLFFAKIHDSNITFYNNYQFITSLNLSSFCQELKNKTVINDDKGYSKEVETKDMSIIMGKNAEYKIVFDRLEFNETNDTIKLISIDGYWLEK